MIFNAFAQGFDQQTMKVASVSAHTRDPCSRSPRRLLWSGYQLVWSLHVPALETGRPTAPAFSQTMTCPRLACDHVANCVENDSLGSIVVMPASRFIRRVNEPGRRAVVRALFIADVVDLPVADEINL